MKKTTKFFAAFLTIVASLCFIQGLSSCGSKESQLNAALEQVNKMLPMNLGNGISMEKVSSTSEGIVYDVKVDDSQIPMDALVQNKEMLETNAINQLKAEKKSNKQLAELVDYCKESGKKIIYCYTGKKSGEKLEIKVDPSDI